MIPLYENGKVPNAVATKVTHDTLRIQSWLTGRDTLLLLKRVTMPFMTVFSPPPGKASGTAMVICSGGSYGAIADNWEGIPAAKAFSAAGITCFLLHYRLPKADMMVHKEIGPVQDVQRAMQYIRTHAVAYGVDTSKVGLMGFSAGGHLVSTAGTHFQHAYIDNPDKVNLRPDFMVLVYPVISFTDSLTHSESRNNLVGPDITQEKINEFSNERQVTHTNPPVFITHAIDDDVVPVANSLYFTAALQQQQVPVNLFLYNKGGHGFGIENKTAVVQWTAPCIQWIRDGFSRLSFK